MKKYLASVSALALAAVLLMSACSKKQDDKKTDDTNNTKPEEVITEINVEPIDFEFKISGGSAKITGYTGENTEIEIPSEVTSPDDGAVYSVTAIDGGAFMGNEKITSAVIPEGVETIGTGAFQNCSALEKLTMPDTLTSIGTRAFFNCEKLADVTFGKNVNSIGDMAFSDYFTACPWYASLNDTSVIVGDGILLKYNGRSDATFDENVKHVAYYAFLDCPASNLTFSAALESIDEKALVGSDAVLHLADVSTAVNDAQSYGLKYETYATATETGDETAADGENADSSTESENSDVTATDAE